MRVPRTRRAIRLARVAAAVGVALSAAGPAASAADERVPPRSDAAARDVYARNGGWIGAGGAFVLSSFDRPGFYDNSGALSLRAGYRGLEYVAVELLGEVLPGFDGDQAPDGDVSGYAVTANGKLFLPLGRVEPWIMTGIGVLDMDPDNRRDRDDFAFRFATGADLYLTPHLALYVEAAYLLPTGGVSAYRYSQYGTGFLVRF